MKMIKIKNIICAAVCLILLVPLAAIAQNDDQAYSRQTFSIEELAQMLAPVALYPDPLLSQILMAATYPFEVVEAERWITRNPYVKGEALDDALQAKDWDVSVLSLCHYPKILTMMSENISWTARLGDAFTYQEEDVMDTIQELRDRARAEGHLLTTAEQRVIIEGRYIRIEPVSPEYIYVPAYDPVVVYGPWWYPMYPPVSIILPGLVVTGPGIFFSPRVHVGIGVFGWSHFNWTNRHVVIVDIDRTRRYNRHVHRYRVLEDRRWRPDRERRIVRERRAAEIPRFSEPARPRPDVRHWDRKPGPGTVGPDKRRHVPSEPRGIDRDRRPDSPRIGDRDGKPGTGGPKPAERDKPPRWSPPETEKGGSPDKGGPRIIDQDRPRPQDRRGTGPEKRIDPPRIGEPARPAPPKPAEIQPPVIRDRGQMERSEPRPSPPQIDRRGGMNTDKAIQQPSGDTMRREPRVERDDRPAAIGEREQKTDRPDRGGPYRERGDKK
jgi:hypothetical protein